ncbi:hypothetical protein VNO77_23650 [Canavalia gladiata]|uniref:Uncharacterized protein n=1 Tax=Canavalia gladiata TaxID=3824 RepID=A0AAN9QBQ3_CANGL
MCLCRGKGSRALLKKLKHGVLVHDASYYTAVQLEGPGDSLLSVLRMVLDPSPATPPGNHDDPVLSGLTYGSTMIYEVGAPVSQPTAPVTYMWQPTSQQNMSSELDGRNQHTSFRQHDIGNDSNKHDVELSEKSETVKHDYSFKHLWVWIHASAFEEGYDNLKLACQIEMETSGSSVNCFSLKGQLAKLELIGLGVFQHLQKILHPVEGIMQLKKHVAIEEESVSQNRNSSILKNEDHFSSCGILSLNVKDPRELPWKRTIPVEPISTLGGGAQETNYEELAELRGTVLSKEKHRERTVNFCLDDVDPGVDNSSSKVQCLISCPILLLKNDMKELIMGFAREDWIACEMGLPFFPSDFPDCKACSYFMKAKDSAFNQKAEFRPLSRKHLRVPILPPWGIIRNTFKKEISAMEIPHLSTREDLTIANPLPNSGPGSFKISKFDSDGCFEEGAVICGPYPSDISLWTSSSEKIEKRLQMSQSAIRLYFKEHSSGNWGMQIPDDSISRESHQWPIGFVTTASVQGREEQWKEIPMKQRRREIYVLVRNLRSVAYRLALASIVLEHQENDMEFL